jgi:hypothetical protein
MVGWIEGDTGIDETPIDDPREQRANTYCEPSGLAETARPVVHIEIRECYRLVKTEFNDDYADDEQQSICPPRTQAG